MKSPRFDRFSDVSLELLTRRKLLKRTDTKFLVSAGCLDTILDELHSDYGLLRANGNAVARYETLYFDTLKLRCFNDHRRGKRPRHKVRVRHYIDREVSYVEVKTKTNRDKTDKRRVRREFGENQLSATDRGFVDANCGIDGSTVQPHLWTNFMRTSLVGLHTEERITIDTQLTFSRDDLRRRLNGVAIVEVKQSHFNSCTPAMMSLRRLGYRRVAASKYCAATLLLRSDVRFNRFLPTLRKMEAFDAK